MLIIVCIYTILTYIFNTYISIYKVHMYLFESFYGGAGVSTVVSQQEGSGLKPH